MFFRIISICAADFRQPADGSKMLPPSGFRKGRFAESKAINLHRPMCLSRHSPIERTSGRHV